ncbi:hypothetical protein Athai_53910 [Actinocatenispora thailandica]|uniref:DUF4190 domain-containing protein n=1 Tax=Actinocatenispora thailandica TaxID=227318 RepID=A0A7R7DU69_9ACTN|nr:DUF4190 domain-containing protein [Actinocatenispora thailandica]BCJ37888.1 hypothetical protein Athai_53910 [Actinocatenispora thailandica]
MPSAEPESPVSAPPPRHSGADEPATSPGGYGAGATSGAGSYAQPGPAAPGDYAPDTQTSAPAGYGQPSAPAYGQPSAPGYGRPPGPPQYGQPQPPGYPPAGGYGAPPPAAGYGAPQPAGYGAPPQPGLPPGGYAVPPPTPQYGVMLPASKPPNSGLAIGAMVAGIAGCAISITGLCSWILSVPAILAGGAGLVLGIIARKNLTSTSGRTEQTGSGMAMAGIVCGAIGAGLGLIGVIIWVILIIASFS